MDYEALMRQFDRAKNNRANFEDVWQQIAERVLPQMADFNVQRQQGAQPRNGSTNPTGRLRHFASAPASSCASTTCHLAIR